MTPDELRRRELHIIEGPVPVVDPGEENRLRAADPDLDARLPGCLGTDPGGAPCSQERPCWDCQLRRRYLALLLHRERFGRVPGGDPVREFAQLLLDFVRAYPQEWALLVKEGLGDAAGIRRVGRQGNAQRGGGHGGRAAG